MSCVGFHGGSSICELGETNDVVLFFQIIEKYAVRQHPELDWSVLTDRLYRRYLRIDELDLACRLMNTVKDSFQLLPSSAVHIDQSQMGYSDSTRLDWSLATLEDVFSKYFEYFNHCVDSAKGFLSDWNMYKPLKIVRTSLPEFNEDKKRPLQDYDALAPNDSPFWAR